MSKSGWLYIGSAVFFLMGGFYILAASGIAFEDRLSDSAGGPWIQGLGAWAIAIGALVWANKVKEH